MIGTDFYSEMTLKLTCKKTKKSTVKPRLLTSNAVTDLDGGISVFQIKNGLQRKLQAGYADELERDSI